MNKLIIIPIILVLTFACQEDIEIAVTEESEYMVYNQSLECRPLETENGFFLISLIDDVPWLVHIDQSGNSRSLIDISTYLINTSYDSIKNLNISHLENENIMIGFTYNNTENESSQAFIQAIEIQQGGEIVDELNQSIPAYSNNSYEYVAVSKNDLSEWVLVSSYTQQSMDPNIASELSLQTTIYKNSGQSIELESNIQSFLGLSIDQAYTVMNNNIIIILAEDQIGPPDQISSNSSYTLLTIYTDGTSNQKKLDESFVSIDVVKQVDNELLLVGTLSQSIDESISIVMSLDNSNNTSWQNNLTILSSFTPTCILLTDNGFLLGGLSGDTRDFNWNNVYNQTNNTLAMYNFNSDGEIIWKQNQETEFSTLIVGVCQSEYNYSWLLTKKSYNTYNNLALLKTDFEGNFK
jgi:hypothetical protein